MQYFIELFSDEFQPFEVLQQRQEITPNVGAQSIFVGYMRDFREHNNVRKMHISYYSPMTENIMETLVQQAITDFHLHHVYLAHRVGEVLPQSPLVVIASTASHRANAIRANEHLLEALKHNVPLWKKEYRMDDQRAHWVKNNSENIIQP